MKKFFLSFILVFCIAITSTIPAFAETSGSTNTQDMTISFTASKSDVGQSSSDGNLIRPDYSYPIDADKNTSQDSSDIKVITEQDIENGSIDTLDRVSVPSDGKFSVVNGAYKALTNKKANGLKVDKVNSYGDSVFIPTDALLGVDGDLVISVTHKSNNIMVSVQKGNVPFTLGVPITVTTSVNALNNLVYSLKDEDGAQEVISLEDKNLSFDVVKTDGFMLHVIEGKIVAKKQSYVYTGKRIFADVDIRVSVLEEGLKLGYNSLLNKKSTSVNTKTSSVSKDTTCNLDYKNNKSVGKATVSAVFTGKIAGYLTTAYKILPKSTYIRSLKTKKHSVFVKVKGQTTQTTGYEIQCAANKNFKQAKTLRFTNKRKASQCSISKLKKNTKYYVRVRTYKVVKGVRYYSSWSKVKTAKTKK